MRDERCVFLAVQLSVLPFAVVGLCVTVRCVFRRCRSLYRNRRGITSPAEDMSAVEMELVANNDVDEVMSPGSTAVEVEEEDEALEKDEEGYTVEQQ